MEHGAGGRSVKVISPKADFRIICHFYCGVFFRDHFCVIMHHIPFIDDKGQVRALPLGIPFKLFVDLASNAPKAVWKVSPTK